MNVSLTEELEEIIRSKVESGRFSSATEVLRAGLRLLEREEEARTKRLAAIRAQIEEGITQADRGELVDGEDAVGRVKQRSAAKRGHGGR
jgi:antitoxin ParD1/3/4